MPSLIRYSLAISQYSSLDRLRVFTANIHACRQVESQVTDGQYITQYILTRIFHDVRRPSPLRTNVFIIRLGRRRIDRRRRRACRYTAGFN